MRFFSKFQTPHLPYFAVKRVFGPLRQKALDPSERKRDTGGESPPENQRFSEVFFISLDQWEDTGITSRDDMMGRCDAGENTNPDHIDALMEAVYTELREQAQRMLRNESPGHIMQPTALVHEAYLRLAGQDQINWNGETHFRAIAAMAMHRVLIDHVRQSNCEKRGGRWRKVTLDDAELSVDKPTTDILVLHESLEKLRGIDPQQFRIVQLRIFGGLTMQQIADVMEIPVRTVEREWAMAKMWLRREISKEKPDDG